MSYLPEYLRWSVALGIALVLVWTYFRDDCGLDLGLAKELMLLLVVAAVQVTVFIVVVRLIGANNEHSRKAGYIIVGLITALLYKVFHLNTLDPPQIALIAALAIAAKLVLGVFWV